MIPSIHSIKDERIIQARELTTSAGRATQKKCLLLRIENIRWALEAQTPINHFFVSDKEEDKENSHDLSY